MRVPIAVTRIGFAVAAMVAGLVGAALALGASPSPDVRATPTPEPTAHWWADAQHPPRTASVRARVGLDKGTDPPVKVEIDYEIVLQAEDPLLVLVTAGKVTGLELVGRLLGGRLDDAGTPTVQRRGTGSARVLMSGRTSPDTWLESTSRQQVPVSLEVGPESYYDYAPVPTSVVTGRSLTVEVTGMKIVAVSGSGIVEQSPTVLRLNGRPGPADITVEVEDQDFNDVARSYPFADLEVPEVTKIILTGLVLLSPWLALLLASWSSRRDGGIGKTIWLFALVVTVGGALVLAVASMLDYSAIPVWGDRLSVITVVAAAVLIAACGRAVRGLSAWDGPSRRRLFVGCAALTVTAGCIAWSQGDLQVDPSPAELLGNLVLVVAAAVLAAVYRRRFALWGAAIGLSVAFLLAISPVLTGTYVALGSVSFLAMTLTLGLVCVYIAEASALNPRLPQYGTASRRMLYTTGALLFLPVLGLAADLDKYGTVLNGQFGGLTVGVALLGLALVTVTVALARQRGRHAEGVGDVVVWALALASTVFVVVDLGHLVQFSALATGSFLLLWSLLIPRRQRHRGIALAGVSSSAHTALVKAEMRRRLMELSAHDVYRSARGLLRDGSISTREYYRRQQRIDDAAAARGRMVAGVPVNDALATAGGCSPWDGAVAAMLYATPLFVLIVGYELGLPSVPYGLIFNPPWQAVLVLAHIMRWIAYAAIFGYFYPLIRGRSPVAKAMVLVLLILPAELLSVLALISPAGDPAAGRSITASDELLLALGIRTGQALVFCTVLGLAWERRMAVLAGYRWDRLRNIRSLRALATPAGTVIVAIATALGTALAGTAVAALLTTGPNAPPAPASTPSPTQSPMK
ncbi:hypothetical protein ACIBD9_27115 [Micromonospora sp. NPDC050784]|uniref:hypothetical protein n=1 Tax=Micromonospora sp. NPDC050784 TaxID=3364281 RepID=UPI0037933DA1